MLKIKDNVDLKELEKFYLKDKGYCYIMASYCGIEAQAYLMIDKDTRKITMYGNGYEEELFDLIQAGLVEKVGE